MTGVAAAPVERCPERSAERPCPNASATRRGAGHLTHSMPADMARTDPRGWSMSLQEVRTSGEILPPGECKIKGNKYINTCTYWMERWSAPTSSRMYWHHDDVCWLCILMHCPYTLNMIIYSYRPFSHIVYSGVISLVTVKLSNCTWGKNPKSCFQERKRCCWVSWFNLLHKEEENHILEVCFCDYLLGHLCNTSLCHGENSVKQIKSAQSSLTQIKPTTQDVTPAMRLL